MTRTNVEILDEADLGDIRQRLGGLDEDDNRRDHLINEMSAEELVAKKCGWEIGDESWAESYIEIYRQLVAAGVRTEPLAEPLEEEDDDGDDDDDTN